MTPFQYYTRWVALGVVFLVAEYWVIRWAVLAALRVAAADRLMR